MDAPLWPEDNMESNIRYIGVGALRAMAKVTIASVFMYGLAGR